VVWAGPSRLALNARRPPADTPLMRRLASYLGRGVAILSLGLAIAATAGFLAYAALTAAIRHFVE
jgi:hypothetical protein